ncbi:cysteine hydrolase [Hwanghaeella grinnelliae]|uniref:Cysteine hydrolase n=1 Tax=Hwanghaeella grinnelliae TaxID=2500179 RepID=A0A437QYT5_9PROT|nr:isochorismatase family cysteine hydrolase [Hwanghaeella grinnelliae]RVU39650.1 cysteine hydrolase [Hwanghaeella grinnelliae]
MFTVPAFADRSYSFPPEKTALLLIDMQRDFIENAEANGESSAVQAIVPALRDLLQASRSAGLSIAHTREGHVPDLSDLNAVKRERSREAGAEIGAQGALGRYLIRGEYGHDFIDDLRPEKGEWIIDKPGFGAFYATDLDLRLRAKGITHLIIGGVTTQCCVQSTLREAVDRGYRCLTLADGCATFDMALHDATMATIQSEGHLFGWIATCADVADALRGG